MLLAVLSLFQRVHGTCDLFTIECHDTGAQFTLDTACYNSTSDVSFSSDLSGVYLARSHNESTVSGDCIVAGSHLAEYYKCFTANEDASGQIDTNYTAEIVHSMTIDGTNLTIARYGEVFCEPRISIDDSKKAMLISEKKIVGSQPQQNAPVIQIEVNGGDTLGSYVNVSVKSVTDDELYSQELVDCNVTSEGSTRVRAYVVSRVYVPFCGTTISKIESCGVVSLALSLEKTADESTAIANIDDNAVYLCFNFSPYKTCQMFDGSSVSMITSDASYDHDGACLANYKGYPLAVGTYSGVQVAYYSATTGWNYLADHPGEYGDIEL
ncbi:Oidioi.mRNA.OKI2018_I69.chr1.g3228.t1.cds [Oikopleura dioica]|uniref:Oidioi.mRNA.OKI2018_I69.chr1.g3228.t1.cds n=1 Tax=Oikopleura dioica TaxID=34765 RepID=A0ABN7STC1_OIKDI|nr:Oidioi.mRNA.OKI2018_I69.chr1.g3228.t1.cds [Oikopleura dioica]